MAIKIPRDTLDKPRVRAGDSAMLSAVQSSKINYDKLTNTIDAIGTRIQAHNRRIEEQRIDNFNTTNTSLLKGDINQELENIKNNLDLQTDGDYNLTWNTFAKKLETKYKKLYKGDDDAFARFESTMYAAFNDGQIEMWKERRKKVLAEAQVNFNNATQEFKDNLDKQDVTSNIWVSTDLLLKQEEERFIKAKALGIDVDWNTYKSTITDMVWKKIAKFGNTRVDPMDDEVYTNWQQIIKNIKTGKLNNWGGKTLTDTHKKDLLDWAEAEMKDHKTFVTDRNTRLNTENSKPINENINKWRSNLYHPKDDDGKVLNQRKAIEKMILESKLTDSAKEALYTEVRTIANDKASGTSNTDSYGSVSQVDKYFKEIILGQSGGQEWLLKLQEDDLISAKGREWLLDKRDKWTTKIDERQKGVIKEYLDKYDGNIDRLSQTALQTYGEYPHFATIFDGRKQQIRSTLFELLAEGEKAGVSYYSMMEDINSEYYIPFKLDEIYAESWSTIANKLKDTKEFDVATYWRDKQNEALSYFVDADIETEGQQLYSKYESVVTDFDMQQVPAEDARVAVFYKRWLDMPRPPNKTRSDGSKIPINEYENSEEWKKYEKEWLKWWQKGDWNSPNIPKKYKTALGFEDLSKISEK
jgi:hypothetical protein